MIKRWIRTHGFFLGNAVAKGCPTGWPRQHLYLISRRTPFHQISWSLEAARLGLKMTVSFCNAPLARYVKLRAANAPGVPGTFSPPPLIIAPDLHRGTCVTHVPWCMSGSIISGFLWSWWRGKRSRHSRRMRNPQFYTSGKRPIDRHFRSAGVETPVKFQSDRRNSRLRDFTGSCGKTYVPESWQTT